jgi:hypothetical protein
MQSTSPRTNNTPHEISESENVDPGTKIEGVFPNLARQEASSSNSKWSLDTAASVNSLAQRGTSLSELQTMIREFQQLHEFLASEGERLEREISEYAQLSKSTLGSARPIAENILRWKRAGAHKS